jgi:hypothetical protein
LRIGNASSALTRDVNTTGVFWICTLTTDDIMLLPQGQITITAFAIDAAGNTSNPVSRFIAIDLVAPAAPTFDTVAVDGIINLEERTRGVSISGSKEQGSRVAVRLGSNSDGTGGILFNLQSTDGTSWVYQMTTANITNVGEGQRFLSVAQTDAAGNVSEFTVVSIEVDVRPPITPTIAAVSTDNTITTTEVGALISGTRENEATVSLRFGTSTVRTVGSGAGTTWSYALTQADITSMGLGSEVLTVTQTDRAGNTSAAATRTINVVSAAAATQTLDHDASVALPTHGPNPQPVSTPPAAGDAVIDLGVQGQLIGGAQVGGKWFYILDKNKDGLISEADQAAQDSAAALAQQSSAGVQLASPATAELAALWSAFNGSSTGPGTPQAAPPGWFGTLSDQTYWSGQASATGHYTVSVGGVMAEAQDNALHYVALQVL